MSEMMEQEDMGMELAPAITEAPFISDLTATSERFCSFEPKTRAEKALLYTAMNNPTGRTKSMVNKKLLIKDIFCESVNCVQRETGEVNTCPRIVLITEDGESYQSVSMGIFSAVKKLIAVFGLPTWEEPIPVVVREITRGTNNILTLDVVSE